GNPGYTFTGWSPEVSAKVTGTVTYTAQWSQDKYEIRYIAGPNGSLTGGNRTDIKVYGDSFDPPPKPVPAKKYRFTGWSPTLLGSGAIVTGDITFVANFSRKSSGGGGGEIIIHDEEVPGGPILNTIDHIAYIQGYPNNTVRPQGNITREEVAAVFFRLLDPTYRETIRTTEHDFRDVAGNKWSLKHIATLANGDIITGYLGSFRPEEFITRAELATIASRFDKLETLETGKFSDVSGHWAEKYINSAAQKGWVNGYLDGTFKPDQYITRSEFVILVNNVLDRRVHTEHILPDAKQFPDLVKGKWYYEAMQEAINSHKYEKLDDGFEKWTEIYFPTVEM
ncbi:MAG: S-layer homology domain-containing protein, partial [Bacillota bacterium]